MERKERNMMMYIFVAANLLLRAKLENGEKVSKKDLPDIINKVFEAFDYKGKDAERKIMLDKLLSQFMCLLTYNEKGSKVYKVSNRDKLVIALFSTKKEAREFASNYRAAYNLKLPNDVRINVKFSE